MLEHIHGVPVYLCSPDGPMLKGEADALEVIAEAGRDADWAVIPVSRFGPDFFELSTRIAGEIVQKFVNYRMGFAMLGDISQHTDESVSLAAFVRESNRGRHIWFVSDMDELERQLARVTR
jgi:hypothetical protein